MVRTAFVFPGQGAYLPGAFSLLGGGEHRRTLAIIDEVAGRFGRPPVSPLLLGSAPGDVQRLLGDPNLYDLAIFATSVALAEVLTQEFGVFPHAVLGHGMGELAALTMAGVFSVQNGARAVCERGGAFLRHPCPPGGLLTIGSSLPGTVRLLSLISRGELTVAAQNTSEETIVSGRIGGLAELAELCLAEGVRCTRVRAPRLEHHRLAAPAQDAFRKSLAMVLMRPPSVPIFLSHEQRWFGLDDDPSWTVSRHFTMPVRFASSIRTLANAGITAMVECGPGSNLVRSISSIAPEVVAVAPMRASTSYVEMGDAVSVLPALRWPPLR
ncbi:acyltransferase domain-containing protein [Amycolatopsis sp. H20-H5]|uniref:acyltransferase domain-containing protein n=1 Tax=Amycolatopsis sp. H20-H5 TaxID=3046309 RepID=UPI002DBDFF96|nr:acyltransferase domain-containing protein [Amycolatopsis sp. H20-H5]MEC3976614.1 acyltransferase domain-containing protein [Amycolatopsis sp. H20-H5]